MPGRKPPALVALPLPAAALARLRERCEVRLLEGAATPERVMERLGDAEGLLCSTRLPVDAALLRAGPRLRVVSNFGVGFDNVDLEEATRRGIAVCNTPGVLSEAVADLTMGLILALSRRLVDNALFVRQGGWTQGAAPPPLGFDLVGKTLGIVGLGRIGRAVARRARAFGMEVRFHDVFRDPGSDEDFCLYRDLDDLLAESDIVSLHVNLTPETRHLIGARELARMKPSSYLVNTSRGPVVDQRALAEALQRGAIAGAALDVLEVEPPLPDDPICSASNVIILPHVGSATRETRAAMLEMAVGNLLAVLHGEPPASCVNPKSLAEVGRT